MTERKQLTVWVSEAQVENWDEYQEELGFTSRGEMIRRSVEYFYADKTEDDERGDRVVDERLDDIVDRIDRLKADVNDVRREQLERNDIDNVAEEVAYRIQQTLEGDVFGTLPDEYESELRDELEELGENIEDFEEED